MNKTFHITGNDVNVTGTLLQSTSSFTPKQLARVLSVTIPKLLENVIVQYVPHGIINAWNYEEKKDSNKGVFYTAPMLNPNQKKTFQIILIYGMQYHLL